MTRMDQALTNIATTDPKWLMERKAAIERRQREHNERMKVAIPLQKLGRMPAIPLHIPK